jgi:hypothetical protein
MACLSSGMLLFGYPSPRATDLYYLPVDLGVHMAYDGRINMEGISMQKGKVNITMDKDLIEYAKAYAEEQRTTVSEVFTQFVLNLKRIREDDPTEMIMADQDFREGLLETISRIRSGDMKWRRYEEVF